MLTHMISSDDLTKWIKKINSKYPVENVDDLLAQAIAGDKRKHFNSPQKSMINWMTPEVMRDATRRAKYAGKCIPDD